MADARLYIESKALSFTDDSNNPSQNPSAKFIDWHVYRSVDVFNPQGAQEFVIQPGATQSIFSGTRTTSIDGTTQFAVALNGLGTAYRFTYASGTNPALKTSRALVLHGETLTLTANLNGTLTVQSTTVNGVSPLGSLQAGDKVFLPGVTTGDAAGPFDPQNEGFWVVLAASATQATLQRPFTQTFSGASQTVPLTADNQVLGFADDKVLIGDHVDITAGFVLQTRRVFTITAVTPLWFEVASTLVIPPEQQAPGATGLAFYSALKRWVRVEVDRDAAVQFNGDTSICNRVSPFAAGVATMRGYTEKWGGVYSLSIMNRSAVPMKAVVWSVE